jgi:hypothetical protein
MYLKYNLDRNLATIDSKLLKSFTRISMDPNKILTIRN